MRGGILLSGLINIITKLVMILPTGNSVILLAVGCVYLSLCSCSDECEMEKDGSRASSERENLDYFGKSLSSTLQQKKFESVLRKSSAEEIISFLDNVGSVIDVSGMGEWNMAMLHLARISPDEALKRLFDVSDGYYREYDVGIIEALAETDPKSLRKCLSALPDGKNVIESKVNHFGMKFLAKHSPEDAVELLVKKSGTDISTYTIQSLFEEIGKNDPQKALALAEKNFKGKNQNVAMASIAVAVGRNNLEEGVTILRSLPITAQGVESAYQSLVLNTILDDRESTMIFMSHLSDVELSAAMSNDMVLTHLSQKPNEMINFLDKLIMVESNKDLYLKAIQKLARASSEITLKWVEDLPASNQKNQLYRTVYKELSKASPMSAISSLDTLRGPARKEALKGLGSSWGEKNLDDAVQWGQQLSDATERKNLIASAMASAVYIDPAKVANYLTRQDVVLNLNKGERASFFEHTAEQYYSKDLDATIEWLSSIGGDDQVSAVKGMVNKWAGHDLQGLGEWLEGMDPGVLRDTGVKAIITQLRDTHPEVAKQWEATLSKSRK